MLPRGFSRHVVGGDAFAQGEAENAFVVDPGGRELDGS